MRVRTQLALALALLSGFTAALIVAIYFFGSRAILFEQIQGRALSIAVTAASQVDAAALERVRLPGDEAVPEYAAIQRLLRVVRDVNRQAGAPVRFIYTMRPDAAGKWTYVVDAEEPGEDFSPVGSEVEFEAREPLRLDGAYAEKAFSRDSFGTWLTANAPIRDADGRAVALLGVDLVAGDVVGQLNKLLLAGVVAGLVALAVGIAGGLLVSRWFTAPLERIGVVVRRVGDGEFDARVVMDRPDEFGALAAAVNQMGDALREREALKSALVRYASKEVMDEVLSARGVPALKGVRREITVLIVDIRNFTAMSAQLEPEEVVGFLNAFYTRLIEVIFAHRGTFDKFLGDGCLAIFGAPLDDAEHPHNAIRTARAILVAAAELGADLRERHAIELRIGIGVHAGEAIVGHIGSEQRTEYTAIGDTVNVASRLEALTKEYGTQLLVSEAVVRGAGPEFAFREVAEVTPRGGVRALKIYTLAD